MRKCDFLCHDDVIIRLGENDVIVDLGNVVTRCLNDVISKLKSSSQDEQSSLFVFKLPSINACFIHCGIPTQHSRQPKWGTGPKEPPMNPPTWLVCTLQLQFQMIL